MILRARMLWSSVLVVVLLFGCGGGGGGSEGFLGDSSTPVKQGPTESDPVDRPEPTESDPVVADAGPDQEVGTGSLVKLDGSGSQDLEGDLLSYAWSFASVPQGSTLDAAALSDATAVNPSFTPDVDGAFVLQLVASDQNTSSSPDTVTITATSEDVAPVAHAGADQSVVTGSVVSLFGNASSDPEGQPLRYRWTLIAAPAGSSIQTESLSDPTNVLPSFIPDTDGTYIWQLIVNDGKQDSEEDYVTVTASKANAVPVADAGPDKSVATGSEVVLDASKSSDADGNLLTYSWSFISVPAGSSITNGALSSTVDVFATFTPDLDGPYVLQLSVSDGFEQSSPDLVTIVATSANVGPEADAGPDQSVLTGTQVYLNGSASSDPDLDLLSYSWSFIEKPQGSGVSLSNATEVFPNFTVDRDGIYVLKLVVSDGESESGPDFVTISATSANAAPVANAGVDFSVATGSLVSLNGSSSTDADGDLLSYAWSLTSVPGGSSVTTSSLSDAAAVLPSFTPDRDGIYLLNLIVNDGLQNSEPDFVAITATSSNLAPVADAGVDLSVTTGTAITLNGSGSSDADGDKLSYSWSFAFVPDGSLVDNTALSSSTDVFPIFTPDVDGSYVLQLVVNDGQDDSVPDITTVIATSANVAPLADAGVDRSTTLGLPVTLNGSASSDGDGDLLTFAWSFASVPSGSAVSASSLSDPADVFPLFTPDVAGSYVLRLIVNDGSVDSLPDFVTITATPTNIAPIADAGVNKSVTTGTQVTLNGSGSSDADLDVLTYSWSFVSVPTGSAINDSSLSDPTDIVPNFYPDVDGTYIVQLVVNDGTEDSNPDIVAMTSSPANSAPVANAGPDQNVSTGSVVTLNGSASNDLDRNPLTYAWSFITVPSGSSITNSSLSNSTSVFPTFTPDVDGNYVLQLMVHDGLLPSLGDNVAILAAAANVPPVAHAGVDQNVVKGTLVTLDGSASSDANGDSLTYSWSFAYIPTGSSVTNGSLSSTIDVAPTFTPDVDGTYLLQLVVSDGAEVSSPDAVGITATTANAAPLANAGPDQGGTKGVASVLDGSGSSDADGDPLTYSWSFAYKPSGSAATLSGATSVAPTFTPDVSGVYLVELIVSDDEPASSSPDVVIISVP